MVMIVSADGDGFNLDHPFRVNKTSDLDQRAGGLVCRVQKLIPDLAKGSDLRDIGDERGELDQAPRSSTGSFERGQHVPENLCRLGGEISGADEPSLRVHGDLSGDDDELASGDDRQVAVAEWGVD
jgi:hypothetical protein